MGLLDGIASTADHLAGSTDEAVARQFDDTAGGGIVDVAGGDDLGDLLMERPAGREDNIDLPGGSANDAMPGDNPEGEDPTGAGVRDPENEQSPYGLPEWFGQDMGMTLIAVLAVVYLLGQLFDVQVPAGGAA